MNNLTVWGRDTVYNVAGRKTEDLKRIDDLGLGAESSDDVPASDNHHFLLMQFIRKKLCVYF